MTATRELALRAHIHNLLEEYALTHLTTNYVVFTNYVVSEVSTACLRPSRFVPFKTLQVLSASLYTLPTTEPTSLALEPALPDLIHDTLKLSRLPAFEERWETDVHANAHLRNAFKLPNVSADRNSAHGKGYSIRSDRCWDESHDGESFD